MLKISKTTVFNNKFLSRKIKTLLEDSRIFYSKLTIQQTCAQVASVLWYLFAQNDYFFSKTVCQK
jgi:hypothetical protein